MLHFKRPFPFLSLFFQMLFLEQSLILTETWSISLAD